MPSTPPARSDPAVAAAHRVVIVGAGPAGLCAAAELSGAGFGVTVLERDPEYVGGIARTVRYKGWRFDIGGHRFFSKNEEVTRWWRERLPGEFISVPRLSRIFYRGKFFDYPLKAKNALLGLGFFTCVACVLSYIWRKMFPIKPEKSFRDWVTNRFGDRLFSIFFKTYTEKVWGMPCDQISADWAAQRIRGLSLTTAIWNALVPQKKKPGQALVKTLIDEFEYPRLGPGMMWERTAADIQKQGAALHMGEEVRRFEREGNRVRAVVTAGPGGRESRWEGDSFIVSMPLREHILAYDPPLDAEAVAAARRLQYRDFLTVALMVRGDNLFADNWIYIHDPGVKLGRIQNFNNWSREMVAEPNTTCLGLEYFCFEGDGLWTMSDADLIELGKRELEQLGLVRAADVFDGAVVRMEKAYPVYYPGYDNDVTTIRHAIEKLENVQVAGRNGLHKYNNQDHSMMTAFLAARNLKGEKWTVWDVNTDAEYHEGGESSASKAGRQVPAAVKD